MRILCKGFCLILLISYLFYESFLAAVLMIPILIPFYKLEKVEMQDVLKWRLNLQFKDALSGMSAALSAGYSVENSIRQAILDLKCIYKPKDMIVQEFEKLDKQLHMNVTIEHVFFDFADRTDIEDIHNFAWILYTAKRTGGDILSITRNTSNTINERIEVNREIKTLIAAKKMESNIMNLMPLGIIAYLKIGCDGFLDKLYGNAVGIIVMTSVLVIYFAAFCVSRKIVNIHM